MLDNLGSIPRPLFHFLTSLTHENNYARNLCFVRFFSSGGTPHVLSCMQMLP
jgi:hypothetical protein